MRQLRSILTLALAETMADNLVLSDDARDLTAQSTALALLKELCAAALCGRDHFHGLRYLPCALNALYPVADSAHVCHMPHLLFVSLLPCENRFQLSQE